MFDFPIDLPEDREQARLFRSRTEAALSPLADVLGILQSDGVVFDERRRVWCLSARAAVALGAAPEAPPEMSREELAGRLRRLAAEAAARIRSLPRSGQAQAG